MLLPFFPRREALPFPLLLHTTFPDVERMLGRRREEGAPKKRVGGREGGRGQGRAGEGEAVVVWVVL